MKNVCDSFSSSSAILPPLYVMLPFRFRPSLPVSYISSNLGFTDDAECLDFLVGMEAALLDGNSAIDCKLTHSKLTVPSN